MDEEAKNVIGHEEEAAAATVNNDVSINNDVIDLCAPSTSANAIKDVAGGSSQSEHPICPQNCVHPARLARGHTYCFPYVKKIKLQTSSTDDVNLLKAAIEVLKTANNLMLANQSKAGGRGEEEFCAYLCSELKRIKSDKVYQNVKLAILRLVTNGIYAEDEITPSTKKSNENLAEEVVEDLSTMTDADDIMVETEDVLY